MAFLHGTPGSEARDELEAAAKRANEEPPKQPAVPGYRLRSRLYDKINVPLKTMDIIIAVIVVAIVVALIVGMVLPS